MKKLYKNIVLVLVLFLPFLAQGQTWTQPPVVNNVGNALQRQGQANGYFYRFNLGMPGFMYLYTSHQIDSLIAAGGGGTTTHPLTINNSGAGDASSFIFNGAVSRTLSYNSIGAQAALGFTPENVANKATSFAVLNNTLYPTTQAVQNLFNTFVPGTGTVTSLTDNTTNGVAITWATRTTTPVPTVVLGAITPTSTNGVSAATMAFNDATSSIQTQLNGKQASGTYVTSVSGTANRITSTGGTTPVIDISATFEALLGKVANPLSQFASTTSAQLAGVLSDESGTGVVAYTTNPVFTTPNLGTPSAIVGTNMTGTAASFTAGLATNLAGTPALPNGTTATTQTTGDNTTKLSTDAFTNASIAAQSISLTTPNVIFSTPVTFTNTAGAFTGTLSLNTQTARTMFGNHTGSTAAPTFAVLSQADLPTVAQGMNLTAVKTANYTLVANDFAIGNATAGTFTFTLPNAPADGTLVAVKMVNTSGTNTISLATQGSDVFNGGGTTATLTLNYQAITFQYKLSNNTWYSVSTNLALGLLDTRYAATFTVTSPITYSANVIGIQTASGSQAGALSSADWTTFNNKGSGTVTAIGVTTANGVSGTSSGGATPNLTIALGNITPTTISTTIKPATIYQTAAGTAGTDSVMVKHSGGIVDAISPTYYLNNVLTTTGDIIYSSSGSTAARLAIGGTGTLLHGGTTPSYSAVSLTADVSGILPVANGGTNSATQNWIDLSTNQTGIAGNKTNTGLWTFQGGITTNGNISAAAWGNNTITSVTSPNAYIAASTLTDNTTANSTTLTYSGGVVIQPVTIAATGTSETITNGGTLVIGGNVINGTNVTITNKYGLINGGNTLLLGGFNFGGVNFTTVTGTTNLVGSLNAQLSRFGLGTASTNTALETIVGGTTGSSQLRFLTGVAPTSPISGDTWRVSTNQVQFYDGTSTNNFVFSQNSQVVILGSTQTTLVSGVKALSITGVTTGSHAYVTLVSQGGTSTAVYAYSAVCTAGTVTITAETVAGVTVTTDTSVVNVYVTN